MTSVLQLWTSEGKGWGRAAASKFNCQSEGLRDLYVDALLQGRHQQLCDFDDHLSDIAKYGNLTSLLICARLFAAVCPVSAFLMLQCCSGLIRQGSLCIVMQNQP